MDIEKKRVYVVPNGDAHEALHYGADTQIFVAGPDGIRGPYETATHVVERGFRIVGTLDRFRPLPEIAQELGAEDFASLHSQLKAVVSAIQGRMENADFYLNECGATAEQRERVFTMAEQLRQDVRGETYDRR
ncbi:MAG: hypothetical protein A2900_05000 [Candidatus Chisholmbacteria bacterium RIFCSPLOWO2_01_FULL_50_28]|uniref:Uncharacterized protein n=1 Tax=Candidatus Chisholmbacteria bacterium RIFCSPHIGHO2_01_FULL_52_32 TaxID=1797591 RepID=A0A1G1VS73_9BACT|nr:MAG: hypothetical protein A2786_01740 [Candidatus Chisholmbacteria bacterium RIFCSPHIGHO2_01_FULL_52_32]OGY20406.1 MAG: hypothetical protein A2900_05000 [Candidatus Chisholmbacteria bacterium RIFCSPLOWO2_01_FULL_50_28]